MQLHLSKRVDLLRGLNVLLEAISQKVPSGPQQWDLSMQSDNVVEFDSMVSDLYFPRFELSAFEAGVVKLEASGLQCWKGSVDCDFR